MIALPFMLLFGYLGYREARNHRSATGRSPWGISPGWWGLLLAASLVIGAVLITIARRTSRPALPPEPPLVVPPRPAGHPGAGAPVPSARVAPGPVVGETILPRW